MTPPFRSSKPPACVLPRPAMTDARRFEVHGPLQGMEQPSWWRRIFSTKGTGRGQ